MKILGFLFILISFNSQAQVCLRADMKLDESCSCGPHCDTLFDKEYLQILKNSKMNPKKLKAILQNQKATSLGYNKIVRNIPLTQSELANIDKEGRTLAKLNAAGMASLNASLAKKGKKKINLEKAAQDYNRKFMATLSPQLRETLKKNMPSARATFKLSPEVPDSEKEIPDEVTTETSNDQNGDGENSEALALSDENLSQGEEVDDMNFEYKDELRGASENIFEIVSSCYFKMSNLDRIKKPHIDTPEEKQLKSEIAEDIKKMLNKHTNEN